MSASFFIIHSYINEHDKGYIMVGRLTRFKTLVYKINAAEYIKVNIKHNGELNPGVVPMYSLERKLKSSPTSIDCLISVDRFLLIL